MNVIILKNLWRIKNEFIFEDKFDHPILLFQKATNQMEDFSQAQTMGKQFSVNPSHNFQQVDKRWTKPLDLCLKANWMQ